MTVVPPEQDFSAYDRLYNGLLFSLLSWEQLAAFWPRVAPEAGWYLCAAGEGAAEAPMDTATVARFLRDVDELLHREHDEDYCGIVYADDLENPSLIKIFDPNHLGVSCGSSKNRIAPGWVLSKVRPRPIEPTWVVPANRRRWWQAVIGG